MIDNRLTESAWTVAEACADSLLTACAHLIEVKHDPEWGEATIEEAKAQALSMIEFVIIKTIKEGPRA